MKNLIKKPIVFIGTGRNGSTIISEFFFKHKDLAFPSNYSKKFYEYPKLNIIRNIFENKLWLIRGKKKQLNKISSFNPLFFRPAEAYPMWKYLSGNEVDFKNDFLLDTKASAAKIKFIRNYFTKMVKYQNKLRLAFKLTGPSRIKYILSIFPDAEFVVVRRNPIHTISSFLKVSYWNERKKKIHWDGIYSNDEINFINESPDLIGTTFQIKKILSTTNKELQKYKAKYIEINFEDFIDSPLDEIKILLKFCNLNADPQLEKYILNTKVYNRNKSEAEYFSNEDLNQIKYILSDDFKI
tara:strand:- start:5314 stop:6204 length:891 start_codon:yes stop_codon:yes gene_type:complete